jgi:hypothetical protein
MRELHKKTKTSSRVSLWLLLSVPLIATTSGTAGISCEGPGDSIQVTVKQLEKSPPTYSYDVRNLHKSPIMIFALGDTDRGEMQSIPDNIPKTIASPKGWQSGTAFKDESIFMQIFWKTQDSTAMIAPGQSLGGFRIEMPQPSARKTPTFHLDGTPVEPLSMSRAPFTVYLQDGTCVSGRVREEK